MWRVREEKRSGSVDRKGVLVFRRMVTCKRFSFRENGDDNGDTRFFFVFQVYMRRRRQEEMDVWKNKDPLPAFSNSGVHFFFRRMQMSGFFSPLRWTNFFRGGGGGFKSTPRAMSAPPMWCRSRQ